MEDVLEVQRRDRFPLPASSFPCRLAGRSKMGLIDCSWEEVGKRAHNRYSEDGQVWPWEEQIYPV